jgi:deazaflavin-dependent oxidoreductase (nitroreductase family)
VPRRPAAIGVSRFPRWYARWNRLATNKLVRLWAGWVPAMGLLSHVGRKSGRSYRTPLNVFPTVDGVAVFLPYGAATPEWLKNVQAAGGAEIQRYGKTIGYSKPLCTWAAQLVPSDSCRSSNSESIKIVSCCSCQSDAGVSSGTSPSPCLGAA